MKRLIVILFAFITFNALAQNNKQVIDPTVEVNRDFEGKMMEITKGKLGTTIADSLYRFKTNFNYTFFDKPYRDLYEFSPVASANVPKLENSISPELIAEIGMSLPKSPEANVVYSPLLQGNHFLELNGNFIMDIADVPVYTVRGGKVAQTGEYTENNEMDYGVGANYTYAWKSGEFNAYAGYNGGKRKLFQKIVEDTLALSKAKNPIASYSYNFNQLEGGFGVKSSGAEKYGQKVNYAFKGDFRHTICNPLKENLFSVAGEVGPTIGKFNRFVVGIGGKYVDYSGNDGYNYGMFTVTPQYRYAKGNLIFNLGVNIEGKFTDNDFEADKFHNIISPAANISFGLLPDKLWVYAKADGWNSINAWSNVFATNNFITTDLKGLKASSVPVHAEAGFNGRFTDKFSYRIYAEYAMHKGLQQFVYDLEEKNFSTFYSNNNEFAAGAEFDVTTEPFQGGVSFRYASFTKGKESTFVTGEIDAIGFPQLQGSVYGKYNWKNRLSIGVQCNLQGEEKALCSNGNVVKVDAFADLQATVEYAITPAFTVWLRGDNILDAATQYTPFYQRETRGIVAGIIVKL